MAIYLVRHAHAGARGPGGHDRYRQLSEKGWRRAAKIADALADNRIAAVLSSPATRCVQTVEGVARAHHLEVVELDDLWEDASTADAMAVLHDAARAVRPRKRKQPEGGGDIVVCSHGNLIPVIVEQLDAAGAVVRGRGCEKGSVWVLDHDGKRFTRATYRSRDAELVLD